MESKRLIRLNRSQTTRSALSLLSDFLAAELRDMCHFHHSIMLLFDEVHSRFLLVVFFFFLFLSQVSMRDKRREKNRKVVAMDKIKP